MGIFKETFNIGKTERARLKASILYNQGKIPFSQVVAAEDASIKALERLPYGTAIGGSPAHQLAKERKESLARQFGKPYEEVIAIGLKMELTKDQMEAKAAEIKRSNPTTTQPHTNRTRGTSRKGPNPNGR